MSITLIKKELKSNYKILFLFLAILTLYGSVIVAMYDPKLGESLNMMAESMPELFAAFGMMNASATLLDFVMNYYYGFIAIVVPLVFIILMTSRLLTHYMDRGSMAYLLATPHNRRSILLSQCFVMFLFKVIIVVYITCLILLCGYIMFNEIIDISQFLMINVGLLGLLSLMSSLCILSAVVFEDTRLALGGGAGLNLFFLLIQMLSQVSDQIEFLKYLTPLTLFDVQSIASFDTGSLLSVILLFVMSMMMIIASCIIFKKRDISV